MKATLAIILMTVVAVGAFALPWQSGKGDLEKEIEGIIAQDSSSQIGTLTVADVQKILGDISIAEQKAAYVQRARLASFRMPGAGQFMTGDPLGGALFLSGDIALFAGTLLGAYFLLPSNVQIGPGVGTGANGLDYLNTPLIGIQNAWQANSVLAYLPSVGVLAGGMILKHLLGAWSSHNAAARARQNVADGTVTFQPEMVPLAGAHGFPWGMGMMMRWRY